mgnify:CR=1 FL=1
MRIIPAINCPDFECVKEKIEKAAEFFSSVDGWVQVDIADGKFTPHKTWNNPEEFKILNLKFKINVEVHLMVENPQEVVDDWIKAGAKRIFVHYEALAEVGRKNPDTNASDILNFILEKGRSADVEIGLAISPTTPIEEIVSYFDKVKHIQILAVDPGLAGQKFQASSLDKIKFLKGNGFVDVVVEVDGGINLEIAKLCKEAGADILASASYIWNNKDSKAAFEELKAL